MITVQVDERRIRKALVESGLSEKQVQRAARSALKKTQAWVKSRSIKELSSELRIQQKIIRRRVRAVKPRNDSKGLKARIWYGVAPVAMINLGARQTSLGVRAQQGRFVRSAFISAGRKGAQVFKRKGRARLPIERQREEIASPAGHVTSKMIRGTEVDDRFQRALSHELKWRSGKQ